MKIGVFDSGIGGLSVAHALQRAFPYDTIEFVNDSENVPYGTKTVEELTSLIKPFLDAFIAMGCDVIVIACNTLSTTVIPLIKNNYTVPIVALVPMIKPASLITKTKIIAVFATPTTLQSLRYSALKDEFGKGISFVEPDVHDWALMIESKAVNSTKVARIVEDVCQKGADVIVLGCTHYHWIEELIKSVSRGRAVVIQPEEAIVRRVQSLLLGT